jgi:hypothetical protein
MVRVDHLKHCKPPASVEPARRAEKRPKPGTVVLAGDDWLALTIVVDLRRIWIQKALWWYASCLVAQPDR